jgi:hypothetical protein
MIQKLAVIYFPTTAVLKRHEPRGDVAGSLPSISPSIDTIERVEQPTV